MWEEPISPNHETLVRVWNALDMAKRGSMSLDSALTFYGVTQEEYNQHSPEWFELNSEQTGITT